MIKINDYVKYQGKVYKVIGFDNENEVLLDVGNNIQFLIEKDLVTLLTPEETLEYFKGRFEEKNCTLRHNKDNDYFSIKVNVRLDYSFCLSKENGISIYGVHNFVYIPYNLQLLCIEFQNWYWEITNAS